LKYFIFEFKKKKKFLKENPKVKCVDPLESLPILMNRKNMYSSLEKIFKDLNSLVKVPQNQIVFKDDPKNHSLKFPLSLIFVSHNQFVK
jgi:hypothetical protein